MYCQLSCFCPFLSTEYHICSDYSTKYHSCKRDSEENRKRVSQFSELNCDKLAERQKPEADDMHTICLGSESSTSSALLRSRYSLPPGIFAELTPDRLPKSVRRVCRELRKVFKKYVGINPARYRSEVILPRAKVSLLFHNFFQLYRHILPSRQIDVHPSFHDASVFHRHIPGIDNLHMKPGGIVEIILLRRRTHKAVIDQIIVFHRLFCPAFFRYARTSPK